mmetsp:Transcript_1395/g.3529  ORF Transcript_1395/g.3529 Transcript_1395/m.3529 type:complete len:540 (-) Transcript_1395:91-1710(-)
MKTTTAALQLILAAGAAELAYAHTGGHSGWAPAYDDDSTSSSSGKSGKSGGGSGKSGKSGGSKSGKGSSSSSSHDWGRPEWGDHGNWGGHGWGGWDSSSSSSSSGKSGKSGGSKGSKGSSSSSSHGGHWVWEGPGPWKNDGWSSSSSSSSSSGKSGKSGGSGSSSSGSESVDLGKWSDDGWKGDGWMAPSEPVYTAGGSVGGWKADGWDNDGHYKADIDYVRAKVSKLINDSERELIPKFLRLGFHDCVGGCDGCIDLDNADNKGLKEPIEAIADIVEEFRGSYSRADIWALATLVSADMAVLGPRPEGLHFPMRYFGRKDCHGASPSGVGGPDVPMCKNDLTTHELLDFFKKYFDFDTEETVVIMGVHAVGVAHRNNIGFGNKDKEDGWVFDAESYVLNNRYYGMLVGPTKVDWELELVENDNGIPDRYQWYNEQDGKEERPIMTNADMALVMDLEDHMYVDKDGNEGAADCAFQDDTKSHSDGDGYRLRRKLQSYGAKAACPVADDTIELMLEYQMDNERWLVEFERVLEKMVKNGY